MIRSANKMTPERSILYMISSILALLALNNFFAKHYLVIAVMFIVGFGFAVALFLVSMKGMLFTLGIVSREKFYLRFIAFNTAECIVLGLALLPKMTEIVNTLMMVLGIFTLSYLLWGMLYFFLLSKID